MEKRERAELEADSQKFVFVRVKSREKREFSISQQLHFTFEVSLPPPPSL
jgi:hypothetical protein